MQSILISLLIICSGFSDCKITGKFTGIPIEKNGVLYHEQTISHFELKGSGKVIYRDPSINYGRDYPALPDETKDISGRWKIHRDTLCVRFPIQTKGHWHKFTVSKNCDTLFAADGGNFNFVKYK